VFIGEFFPCGDAEKDVLQMGIGGTKIVDIVGGDKGKVMGTGKVHEHGEDFLFILQPVVHDFEEEILLPHNIPVALRGLDGFIFPPHAKEKGNLPLKAAGKEDEAFMVAFQQIEIDPWFVVKPLQEGQGNELDQVLIPQVVHCQGGDMEETGLPCLLETVSRSNVQFTADDALYVMVVTGLEEIDNAEEVSVVGQSDRRHAMFRRESGDFVVPEYAVQKAQMAMDVEMDKGHE